MKIVFNKEIYAYRTRLSSELVKTYALALESATFTKRKKAFAEYRQRLLYVNS